MTRPSTSATNLLERPERTPTSTRSRGGFQESPSPAGAAPSRQGAEPPAVAPAPLGWGSHAERRLMRQALGVFFALGLYATAFVLLGYGLST